VDVYTFIGRMMQQVCPKGFQRIRSYGVQATKTVAKIKGLMQEAVAKVRGMVKGAIKIIAAQSDRERDRQRAGRDPLRCPHCHHEMDVWKVRHPKDGVGMTRSRRCVGDDMRRQEEVPQAREDRDAPFWATSHRVSVSLSGLWYGALGA